MKGPALYWKLLLTGIILSDQLNAQPNNTAQPWSLDDCIRYATEHNIQINTLRLDQQTTAQNLEAARGAQLPSLSATVSNTFDHANNNAGTNGGGLVNQLTSNGTYSLNAGVTLWNDHYLRNNIQQQSLVNQSAGLSVLQSQNSITLLVAQDYLNILLAKENEKYVTDVVSTSKALVTKGQLLYDAGSIAKKDLLQLQAQLASDQYLLVQTQNTIRQNILALKQLLQLPTETAFDVVMPANTQPDSTIPDLSSVQQWALDNFPDAAIGKLGQDIAALDIAKAKAGFKPVVKANAAVGSGYSAVLTNAVDPKTGYFNQTGNNFYQNLGVSVSIPIFSNRINKTNVEKANIGLKQAGLNYDNTKLVLLQEVEQAYLNTMNGLQSYTSAQQQLTAVTESYRITNEQFRLGAINTYDLLQQRNLYVQAVQAFTNAKYTALLQEKMYAFYMGKPVTL